DKVKSDNPLVEEAVEDSNSGKEQVAWNFTMMPSEEWKNQLGQAMLAYAQGNGSWDDVQKAFVDNWKTEYDNAHAN
ncbi:ABC transporter substrate-binding protein, partial [Bifidobacterium animalis]